MQTATIVRRLSLTGPLGPHIVAGATKGQSMQGLKRTYQRAAGLLVATLIAVTGCATVPDTERRQVLLLSPQDEVRLGLEAFDQVRDELDLIESGPEKERVERIGERIVAAASNRLRDRGFDSLEWEFHVVEDDQVNAFVLPAGKIVFYTGLLDLAADDDEVAAVMGHEVAHVVARHAGERISQNVLIQMGLGAAAVALSDPQSPRGQATMAALGLGAQVGVQLPFSRIHEAEADEIGLFMMAEAGYDPRAAVSFWDRMDEMAGDRPPTFLSTHPGPEQRRDKLESLMPRALAIYEQQS